MDPLEVITNLVLDIGGVRVYSTVPISCIRLPIIEFEGGATCNIKTKRVVTPKNFKGHITVATMEKTIVDTFSAQRLKITSLLAQVTIIPCDESDQIHIKIEGARTLVDSVIIESTPIHNNGKDTEEIEITIKEKTGKLEEDSSTDPIRDLSMEKISDGVMVQRDGIPIIIPRAMYLDTMPPMKISVEVPIGTFVSIMNVTGGVEIGDIQSEVSLSLMTGEHRVGRIRGLSAITHNSKITVAEARGVVKLTSIMFGNGTIDVCGGHISHLEVHHMGDGAINIKSPVEEAYLVNMGETGRIEVATVLTKIKELSSATEGGIKIGKKPA